MLTCMHAYMHMLTCMEAHACAHTHTCTHTHTHTAPMLTCMHAYICTCQHVHAYARAHTHTHTHPCMHTYMHAHTHLYYFHRQMLADHLLLLKIAYYILFGFSVSYFKFLPNCTVGRELSKNGRPRKRLRDRWRKNVYRLWKWSERRRKRG